MPYAANGKIAEDKFPGSIKITADQYAQALEGMCAGLVVTIEGGFKVAPAVLEEVPPAPELTPEEIAVAIQIERDRLLARATLRMGPLQDAIDLGNASADEVVSLNDWKQYRVDLNRIEQQAGFPLTIEWPVPPDATVVR